MAEFNFYGCWDDSISYLRDLTEMNQFIFTVDRLLIEGDLYQFDTLTEGVEEVLQRNNQFFNSMFLWDNNYSRFPIRYDPPSPFGTVRIDPLRSGPMLNLDLPVCKEREGKLDLGAGCLIYQPFYINPETDEAYKPPEQLKQAYRSVQKILQKDMVKMYIRSRIVTTKGEIKPTIEPRWFGQNAFKRLEAGEACIFTPKSLYRSKITISDLARTRQELEPLVDEYADE